jgi:hypothetical protein
MVIWGAGQLINVLTLSRVSAGVDFLILEDQQLIMILNARLMEVVNVYPPFFAIFRERFIENQSIKNNSICYMRSRFD